ncbi:MAG: L-rhamnose isomerase [Lentisphaeria bacterium]|nr:L-rhamnose isomerase [Lentisphaeria bacterium]
MNRITRIENAWKIAKDYYGDFGVDAEAVLASLEETPISIHCWQGDDVVGFEHDAGGASGGILTTGNYPGRARNAAELRQDLDQAMSMIPGTKRVNLHAIYAETGGGVDRADLAPEHFRAWIEWAQERGIALDFNPTCFSHPNAASGFTLSSRDDDVRAYWIRHVQACRRIAAEFGRVLGKRSLMNIWIPDGFKDIPADRMTARRLLKESLDEILSVPMDPALMRDAVESKLFGIGLESCTVGSHEFYLGYAVKNNVMLTLDSGHFHPTEAISDKISSALLYLDEILLHVSRPVRWDSDHVVILDDELQMIANEIVRCGRDRVNIALDYFDATINRVAAWAVGTRAMQKALCRALLEPPELKRMEAAGDYTGRLILSEEIKSMPWEAVYAWFCLKNDVPAEAAGVLDAVRGYEQNVTSKRT